MTKADQIRALSAEGLAVSEIARRLGTRYQHVYSVLNRSPRAKSGVEGRLTSTETSPISSTASQKPFLTVEALVAGGFRRAGRWLLSGDSLMLESPLPKSVGVYAFVKSGITQYVGVATMGLSKRLYFYGRPGITQHTSQRIHSIIKNELLGSEPIEIYVASPPDLNWNGLPIHGSAGLELGLIKTYTLPWNMRSANS